MKHITKVSRIITPYIIVIPTYARQEIIYQRTLKTLYECNINSNLIYLFYASNNEMSRYLETYKQIKDLKYKKWLSKCKCVVGVLGLKNQRNFISQFFKEGQYILQMDDDIQDFYFLKYDKNEIKNRKKWNLQSFKSRLTINTSNNKNNKTITKHKSKKQYAGYRNKNLNSRTKKLHLDTLSFNSNKNTLININNTLKTIKNPLTLHQLIIDTFKYCNNNSIYLWGIYPVENAWFMSPEPTTKLKFIVGPCFGIINRYNKELKLTIDEKENVERTLQYWKLDGKVLRLNNITLRTQYYKVPGGMQDEGKDRKVEALKSAEYLHARYPSLTKIYLGKKSGHPELKLISPK